MTSRSADALVFFGATGDLAHKKIFPALHGMARRGQLTMPVIAVAKSGWTLDQLRARAVDSIEHHGGIDRDAVATVMRSLVYIDGDYGDPVTFSRLGEMLDSVRCPVHYLAIPPKLLTNVTVEPPPGLDPELVRDEKAKVLKGIAPLRPEDVVRGQFLGYRDEPGVAPGSTVETYVALKLSINSWRWKDVPFYIRAGKRLPVTATEVVVKLRQAPAIFSNVPPPANYFRFQVTPTQTIAISSFVKLPGEMLSGESVELTVSEYSDPTEMGAYEELLTDAVRGVAARFARQDYVEEAWRIVDPVLDDAVPVYDYEPGTWGPAETGVVAPAGGWFDPLSEQSRKSGKLSVPIPAGSALVGRV